MKTLPDASAMAGLNDEDDSISLGALFSLLTSRWRSILGGSVVAGALGFGGAMLLPPIFTAQTLIMPPQQQQNGAAAALGALGALGALAGGGLKNTADQYIGLMQSATVSDRLIDRFKLMAVYGVQYRMDARKVLLKNVTISVGKKDGLISVAVDDEDPQRAADMANAYVDHLRQMTNTLAVSEAQQRRQFFEQKLGETKERLTQAQISLQAGGFNSGALRAEPKAAAEGYARIRAELTSAEIKLQTLRGTLADGASEVRQQQTVVTALRAELSRQEQTEQVVDGDPGYISRYREYKYQETLFDLYAKQFELARADEGREGALIQVVDVAQAPERKSKPQRALLALGAALLVGFVLAVRAVLGGFGNVPGQTGCWSPRHD
ncbi:MAG: hypothetical protein RL260_1020 [Pseudomonadota bacterium]|jgi:uncharacterized protein involved in exopolysaccharide biosynthesis